MMTGKDKNTTSLGLEQAYRPRRLRRTAWLRDMVGETHLRPADLIWPLFILEGKGQREAVASMPGIERTSVDFAVEKARQAAALGIPAIALFPVVAMDRKSPDAEESYNPKNLMCRAIAEIKSAVPEIGIIADVALDPYTSHGHDGVLDESGYVLNDETVEILCRQAVVQAEAGADIIAPSDMMDGRVGAIRQALDDEEHINSCIMSYAAKFASAFYGPFRDAVGSGDVLKGDKKTYQINPANALEALREVELDIAEGADMVMVKPGLPYLDIITRVKEQFEMPTFGYHVSGEYAMLRAAAENGWVGYEACMMETLLSFKRAGCDGVLTYAALDAAKILNG